MPELEEEYGIKRICQSCGARYYDLNADPAVCPSCGTEYDPEAVMRSRRGRVAAAAVATAKEEAAPDPELADTEEAEPKADAAEDDEDEDEGVSLTSYRFLKGAEPAAELDITKPGSVAFIDTEGNVAYLHEGRLTDTAVIQEKIDLASGV